MLQTELNNIRRQVVSLAGKYNVSFKEACTLLSFSNRIRKVELKIAEDISIGEACKMAGISTKTYYKYKSIFQ